MSKKTVASECQNGRGELTNGHYKARLQEPSFPAKIGRRLTLAFAFLIAGVLLIGGFSLYLATEINRTTDKIKTIAARIEHADHMHVFTHHLITRVNREIIFGDSTDLADFARVADSLKEHIKHYQTLEAVAGGEQMRPQWMIFRAVEEQLGVLFALVDKARATWARGSELDQKDLARIRDLDYRLRTQFLQLNRLHQNDVDLELRTSQQRMRLITGMYLGFLIIGVAGLGAWSWVVSRTIVSPLRDLAKATLEVGRGELAKRVRVGSRDEIGQLSHFFNVMTEQLRDHEEKLKCLAALEERQRIAQELHNSLAQELAFIRLKVADAEHELSRNETLSLRQILGEVKNVAGSAYDNVCQAIFGLRALAAKGLGLIPALTEYLHDFSERSGIPVGLKVNDRIPVFSVQTEVQLIRIIQEALSNILKHSGASSGEVRFEGEDGLCKVVVEDNGKGFALEKVMGRELHYGIRMMSERAQAIKGDLKIETAPGRGTRVIIYLPVEERSNG